MTVLALLPTLKDDIVSALPVERTVEELQQKKAERLSKSVGVSDLASSDLQSAPSVPPSVTDEDGAASLQSGSYVHASQMAQSAPTGAEGAGQKSRKSKTQLWNEMKISCKYFTRQVWSEVLIEPSNHTSIYPDIQSLITVPPHPHTVEPSWSTKLPVECGVSCCSPKAG